MFLDNASIIVSSGNGGAGAVSFRREKFITHGGPDGGDGGKGGDVLIHADTNTHTLSNFRSKKHYKAAHGSPGKAKHCAGKHGADLIIKLPLGTQVFDAQSGALLLDVDSAHTQAVLLRGGKGGLGNFHFKNARNQAPTYAQKGLSGTSLHLRLELKLIADVGLVGYPNAGKSSLISVLSNAKPEIASYAFTTLTPHLGVVDVDELHSFVMADIPGIIEGASMGKGLGLQFLQHIERTKFLLFVLDGLQNPCAQYHSLRHELHSFSDKLTSLPFGIVLSKDDVAKNIKAQLNSIQALFTTNNPPTHHSSNHPSASHPLSASSATLASPTSSNSSSTFPSSPLFDNFFQGFKPYFILSISSVTHSNTTTLRHLLYNALTSSHSATPRI